MAPAVGADDVQVEWQTPVASMRTSASPGPGSSRSICSTPHAAGRGQDDAAIHDSVEFGRTLAAHQRQGDVGIRHQVADHRFHARVAADREPVGVRPAEQDGVRAERERLEHVGAAPDAAVHQHDRLAADRRPHPDERVERRDGAVHLAPAVVGDHDPVGSVLECRSASSARGRP